MSNATQQLKAQQRRQKFADLLREMFQLNQPELDFGLYRIMHARKDDINRFIEQDLPRITQEAFSQYASQDQAQLEAELEEHIKSAKGLGMDPDAIPKVQELQQKLQGGFDLAREEGEVYDALVTFFNRYYNEGDFLSRRVYKDGTYAIPYQGEEVVLHWANKDQYYIKSSETLRDYSFRLNPNAGPGEDPMRVHFKLVDAEAGAKDNNKESADSRRVFVLEVEKPFELIEGETTEHGEQHTEVQCRFVLRPAAESDWTETEKKKATAAAQKKPPTQDALRAIAEERLLGAASDLPEPWKSALAKPYRKADGSRADYSMLAGQLNNYTKKNTFDYFIHKDLAGFLSRELDFYIKNELLDWEDIASLKNDTARLAPLLSKIEVIRSLGEKIIGFLAQLEDFQKKLWLKKKFVTETNYCITLDWLEVNPELLSKVFENERQIADWVKIYKFNEEEARSQFKSLTPQELLSRPEYRFMMVDTKYFDVQFKSKLLESIDNLDDRCDGFLIDSENFQALNFLKEKYRNRVDSVYIDPPYNTGGDGFAYKDNFQHSSWASSLFDRIDLSRDLLSSEFGSFFASIDDGEQALLREISSQSFGADNFVANVIWQKKYAPANDSTWLSDDHDFIMVYAKNKDVWRPHKLDRDDKQNKSYSNPDDDPRGAWMSDNYKCNKTADERPNLYYAIINPNTKEEIWPNRNAVWRYTKSQHTINEAENRVWWGKDGKNTGPRYKRFLSDVGGIVPRTIWKYDEVGHNQDGIRQLREILPESGFTSPKPVGLVKRICKVANSKFLMDFYAGSGTTGQAAIDLSRKEGKKIKYILVEMGSYFDTDLKPRLIKSVYSSSWKSGRLAGEADGLSHLFKYIRLESYEDTLGNLMLSRSGMHDQLFGAEGGDSFDSARESYILNYMLSVETRGSQSLLNARKFVEPTEYKLDVRSAGGDETKRINVDLLETFNYLLGLEVEHIAAPIHFEAELNQGEYGRWQAKVRRSNAGKWWFRTVYGTNRAGQQVLVVWRNLPSVIDDEADGIQKDNAVLDAVLIEKLSIRLTESQDDEIDVLYVNGDHNISIPRSRKGEPMEQARIQLIEEAFHRLMFADTEAVH
ncbi:site-specific DNA-methyltransferase [Marinobacter salsuginis]|uniref:site-specific DNA-methyltransferase n=1 Tax=Marinobacter salsuginis TaxID=418719 RepID=UPI00274002B9|nr:site-specific DNA-methyltransferase [Marinobacter salsuginis]